MSESAPGRASSSTDGNDKDSSVPKYQDAEYLQREYHEKRQTIPDIAEKVGVCNETVRSWMVRLGVPRRDRTVKIKTVQKNANDKLSDEGWLTEQYVELEKSITALSKELGVTEAGVLYWLRKYGIETRTKREAANKGSDHYAWTGGHPEYYGSNWRGQREKVLERDDHVCRVCSTEENLHVHHVHKIQKFDNPDDANYLENLVTLCQPCHNRWEGIPVRPL